MVVASEAINEVINEVINAENQERTIENNFIIQF
jgi:hypothetical protein